MRKIFSALDIGNDTIKLVVGEVFKTEINVLCAIDEPNLGFKANKIEDEDKFMSSINNLINKASKQINFKIKKIILNLPVSYNNFIVTDATNTITNEDKMVSSNDILRILQSSTYNRINITEELVGIIPIAFRVGDEETNEPYGKKGSSISVKSVLITSNKKEVYDIINTVTKCDLEVIDITTTGLVDYYNFKNDYYNSKIGVVINMGGATTTLSIINKGIFINSEILNIGGIDVDKDISYIYNVKRNDAKYLKENLALASDRNAEPKETLKMVNKDGEEVIINQYELTQVVSSRLTEMLNLIKKSINHLTKKEISYIIITGGLTEIKDFPILLSNEYANYTKVGNINTIGVRNNKYSVCMGMLNYFNEKLKLRNREYSIINENDIELMCNKDSKLSIPNDSILGKIFGYFFDN